MYNRGSCCVVLKCGVQEPSDEEFAAIQQRLAGGAQEASPGQGGLIYNYAGVVWGLAPSGCP